MMQSALLQKQLQRLLPPTCPSMQSATLWPLLQDMADQEGLSASTRQLLNSLPIFLHEIDQSYQSLQREIELGRRSLDLSTHELGQANAELKNQALQQHQAIEQLYQMVQSLAQEHEFEFIPEQHSLNAIMQLLQQLCERCSQMQASLKQSQERFQLAVESAGVGLWDWDLVTGEFYFSQEWCALLGYTQNELDPHFESWNRLIHPDDYLRCGQVLREHIRGKSEVFETEMRMRHHDGQYIWMLTKGKVMRRRNNGTALRALGTMINISARKQVEWELARNKNAAERANHAKNDFLARISHQVRTPLHAIIGMTQLCLDTAVSDQQKDYLQMVMQSTQSLTDVINDVLDFEQIEQNQLILQHVDFDLRQVFEDVTAFVQRSIEQKGLELCVEIQTEVPQYVCGDAVRVRQILLNLLNNAIQFTEKGRVEFLVQLRARTDTQWVLAFEIKDTGIGIDADELYHIFDSFTQGRAAYDHRQQGVGLGLTLASRLVQLHGSDGVYVSSEPHKGSSFYFDLPFQIAHLQNVNIDNFEQLRVLIVDDQAISRRVLKDMMHQWGVQALSAPDTRTAMMQLFDRALDHQAIEIVFIDADMPDMAGYQLATNIQQSPNLGHPKIVLVNSSNDSEVVLEELGVCARLTKPLDQHIVYQTLKQAKYLHDHPNARQYLRCRADQEQLIDQKIQVLLVEDNAINQKLATSFLSKAGYDVVLAVHGQQAVEFVERQPFDVILMDIQMPVMDGEEATKIIRQREGQGPYIPIIAMTAHHLPADRERFMACGMNGFIAKPMRFLELQQEIERVLSLPIQWKKMEVFD